ncbi:hypothetical protein BJG94_11235 [Rhizobium sp. Td3]|nr:hypothetical protein BJG94_11235 [Rhizobium sp. Td3]
MENARARESIRPEDDQNRPVSEKHDPKCSPIGIDDGDFRGQHRTWEGMLAYVLLIFVAAVIVALFFLAGVSPGRVS